MLVLPPRVLPFIKHFFFLVVVSSFAPATVFFVIGTLTRNVKIVYGLAISFYPLFIAWQLTIRELPTRWRIILDPLLLNAAEPYKNGSPEWLNQVVIGYDVDMIANRAVLITVSLLCLVIAYFRFSPGERATTKSEPKKNLLFNNATPAEKIIIEAKDIALQQSSENPVGALNKSVSIPQVEPLTQGFRAGVRQFTAALEVEFRLLGTERSLVVIAPLVVFLCGLNLAGYEITPEYTYSATYAERVANILSLFLFGMALFYIGEAMHRDRDLKIELLLWSAPVPNFILLISKFVATLLLSICLIALADVASIGIQISKGHTPLEMKPYLVAGVVILIPNIVFMIASSLFFNTLLRNKYLAYIAGLTAGGATYFLSAGSYNNRLYNPTLFGLWTSADLVGSGNLSGILTQRIYCLALAFLLLALAHVSFERKSTNRSEAWRLLNPADLLIILSTAALFVIYLLISD